MTRTAALRALSAALALTLSAALPTACRRDEQPRTVGGIVAALDALDARHEPLRARFDREADTPRVLVLTSPT